MSLTPLQRRVCRILADRRIAGGERYVAGGLALNAMLGGQRQSRDIDLFHDTDEALRVSSEADVASLRAAGLRIDLTRASVGIVEVAVHDGDATVEVQWVRDSAFRFFPLLEHPELGLTLHPLDLATNKVLALVGRVVVRDWVDILTCHATVAPLGCLAWAASGKDAGLGPGFILEEAARTAHYSKPELEALAFDGTPPDHVSLTRTWREALAEARTIVAILPPDHIGEAVIDIDAKAPFRGTTSDLSKALTEGRIHFHPGSIGGAFPTIKPR